MTQSADLQKTVALGQNLCRQNRHQEAALVFQQSLARQPDEPLLWFGLANVHLLAGRLEEALQAYRRAAALAPLQPAIPAAMANVHNRLDQPAASAEALVCAITLGMNDPVVFHNLGNTLIRLGRIDQAIENFKEAVKRFPEHAGLWISLGNLQYKNGTTEEAFQAMQRAVTLAPEDDYAMKNLARKLHRAKRLEEATEVYRRVVARDPQDTTAAHILAALTGQTTAVAPEEYVRDSFDEYAERFDNHLIEVLGYRTPTLLRTELDRLDDGPRHFARALDLGCGTGLSAPPFRDLCDRLTGVDLSAKMIEKAREKGLYDRLCQSEVISFLETCDGRFDLVIAADVFVYIGDLSPVFAAVSACTGHGALFVFSTERSERNDPFVLTVTGRYAHTCGYVQHLAQEHGFVVASKRTAELRKEHGQWVDGYLFILKRFNPDGSQ